MDLPLFRPVRLCVLLGVLGLSHAAPTAVQAQEVTPTVLPGWQALLDQPGLSDEQRRGARFAAQHLPIALFDDLPEPHQQSLLRYAADHSDGKPELVLCWEQSTPSRLVKPFLEIEYAGQLVKHSRQDRRRAAVATAYQADDSDHWGRTASNGSGQGEQGFPITLTWSIVPDGTIIPGGVVAGEGVNEPSILRAWLAGIYGGSATGPATNQSWFSIFQTVFDNIAAKTGVQYVYEPNDDGATLSSFSSGEGVIGVRGDVRISGHGIDGNNNVLAYDYFPDYSDMVIDTSDSFFNSTANNSLGLRNVLEHEHGHGLGVSHVCPVDNTKLMEPFINLGFTGIQFDDIFTLQRLYGDALEVHGSERDNDSFSTATPVTALPAIPYVVAWLGIDGSSDTDYISFDAPAGSQVTVRVIPSVESYLEGEQNASTGNCTSGTSFDSSILQDLGLTVFGSDQSTVVGVATNQPAGSTEEAANLIIDTAGTYYAQIVGNGANVNQLYRLEILVGGASYAFQLASATLVNEMYSGANGVPDPGETVRLNVVLENVGGETATNLMATLTGPPGFQGFAGIRSYGNIGSGSSTNAAFTFALNGQCGDGFRLSLDLTVDGENAGVLPLDLVLGQQTPLLDEDFDSSNELPLGWGNEETGRGSLWSVVASPSNPGYNSLFAEDYRGSGQSILTSPPIAMGSAPGSLTFTHLYDTEPGWDGCVLEILIGNSSWQDILTAGGAFVSGGYNDILGDSRNPIDNRNAWSGDSGGFITTEVALPIAVANQTIQLRWIIGHDQRIGWNGWYLETIDLTEFTCEAGAPTLTLSSVDAATSEYFNATDTAVITVSTALPVTTNIPVTLNSTGSANADLDVVGFGNISLTTGQVSTSLVLTALSDGLVEGNETLTISSPDASGTVLISILDTPYGQYASTNLGTTGLVNPFDDYDTDGSLNIEELVFGSDLANAGSRPLITLQPDGDNYKLGAPLVSLPEGVIVEGESSVDFLNWSLDQITILPDGFQIPGDDPQRFLRLKYSVRETAP